MVLKEMFPLENQQVLRDALLQCNGSMDDAVERLLSKQCDSSSSEVTHLSPLPSQGIVRGSVLHQPSR